MAYPTKAEALRRQAHYDKQFADFCQHDLQGEKVAVPGLRAVTINFYLQATEKVLKSMAAERGEPVRNTHAVIDELVGRPPDSRARSVLRRALPQGIISDLKVFQRLVPRGGDETLPNVEYPFGAGSNWRIPAEFFDSETVKKAARVCGHVFNKMNEYIQNRIVGKLRPSGQTETAFRTELLAKFSPRRGGKR